MIHDMNEQFSPSSSDEISSESFDDIEAKKKKKLIHQLAAKYDIKTLQKLAADADLHSNNQLSTSETKLWKSEEFTSAAHKNLTDPEQNVKTDETVTAAGTDFYSNNQLVPVSSKTKFWKSEEFTSAALKNLTDPGQNVKTDETVTEASKKLTVTQNHLKKETTEILLRVGVSGLSNRYTGDMFVVKDLSEGKAIDEKETMFCRTENYEYAENSKSTTMAARRLLGGVFTVEALQACSISGMPPRGKGKAAYTEKANIKPYLCPKAVKAIIDEALRLQHKFHWRPKKDRTQIRQAMGVRISEIAKMRIRLCNSSATDQL